MLHWLQGVDYPVPASTPDTELAFSSFCSQLGQTIQLITPWMRQNSSLISKLIQKRSQATRNPEEDSAQKVQTNSETFACEEFLRAMQCSSKSLLRQILNVH